VISRLDGFAKFLTPPDVVLDAKLLMACNKLVDDAELGDCLAAQKCLGGYFTRHSQEGRIERLSGGSLSVRCVQH
jgi:hypothetical protein